MSIRRTPGVACALAAAALAAAGCGGGSAAQSSDTPTVRIMVGGLDKQIYLPAMLAQRLGYFKQQGLDVQLSDEPAGVDATNQLVAGKVEGAVGFYDHTVDLAGQGKHTESVAQLLRVPGEVVMCRNDQKGQIASPASWKDRRIGVTSLGSSTYFLSQYLAVENGVAASQIHPLAVKAGPTFLAAMQHKTIDCGMTTEPTISAVQRGDLGWPLVDMRTERGTQQALGGLYPASALYMRNDWVQQNKPTVQKLVNAFVQTMHWIAGHSAAQIAAKMPPEYYQGVGKQAYIDALAAEKDIYTPDGVMPAGGPQTVLKVLQSFDPNVKGKDIDLSQTYTTRFAERANAQLAG
jgi:NitT/TauT family transport system substrate-binding protein